MEAPKTWKPTVAGILLFVAVLIHLAGGIFEVILVFAVGSAQLFNGFFMDLFPTSMHQYIQVVMMLSAFYCLVGIVLELLGGVYAIKRKKWIFTVIGSVCALLAFFPVGIPALIFTITSKNEFK